jgi:hypothetical protein
MDNDQIAESEVLDEKIREAIHSSDAFVLLSSASSIRSSHVIREAKWALEEKASREKFAIVPMALEHRSYYPQFDEITHVRSTEFPCLEASYLRLKQILLRHGISPLQPKLQPTITKIFDEFGALKEWIDPLRAEGRIRIAAVQAVPRYDVPTEIIEVSLILLSMESLKDSWKCYLFLSISAGIVCKYGFGYSPIWSRTRPNDPWLLDDMKKEYLERNSSMLCSDLSENHTTEISHKFFSELLSSIEPLEYLALTNFLKFNHSKMNSDTTERLSSLVVRKDPQGKKIAEIEAISMFHKHFPENTAILETIRAWLLPSEFAKLNHKVFLDEIRLFFDPNEGDFDWVSEQFVKSFRNLLRQGKLQGIELSAFALNHALRNRQKIADKLHFEWNAGLMSHELENYRANIRSSGLLKAFSDAAPMEDFELHALLNKFLKNDDVGYDLE